MSWRYVPESPPAKVTAPRAGCLFWGPMLAAAPYPSAIARSQFGSPSPSPDQQAVSCRSSLSYSPWAFDRPIAEEVCSPVTRIAARELPTLAYVRRTYRLLQPSPTSNVGFGPAPVGGLALVRESAPALGITASSIRTRSVAVARGAQPAALPGTTLGRSRRLARCRALIPTAPIELGEHVSVHPALRADHMTAGKCRPLSLTGEVRFTGRGR